MDDYDGIIVGAGHNSLVCAAYLARAGQRILIVEGAPQIGGGTTTDEVNRVAARIYDAVANLA